MQREAVIEQINKIDDRYSPLRTRTSRHNYNFYLHKRRELLANTPHINPVRRHDYLQIRESILHAKYATDRGNFAPQLSPSTSRGPSLELSRTISSTSYQRHSRTPSSHSFKNIHMQRSSSIISDIVPTQYAEASRAMVGASTLGENYAFTGMHHIFDQHKGPITAVKFAHDSLSKLCIASRDKTLSICDCLPTPTVVHTLSGHLGPVNDFEWSQQNDFVLSCSDDGTARLWDTATGVCLRVIRSDDEKEKTELMSCIFHTMNNNIILVGSAQGKLLAFNVSTGKQIGMTKVGTGVTCLVMDKSGENLWVGTAVGLICTYRFSTSNGVFTRVGRTPGSGTVTSLAYRAWVSRESGDPYILCSRQSNLLQLYGVDLKKGTMSLKRVFPVKHIKHPVKSCFCPLMSFHEGAVVVSGSEDGIVYFFDIGTQKSVNKLQGHMMPVTGVSWNADESLLASGSTDGVTIVWKRLKISVESPA